MASARPTLNKKLDIRAYVSKQLDLLVGTQETLAEKRQTLIVKRSTLRTRRKQVQEQRMRAGDAEAAFMNELRKFYNEHGSVYPIALTVAYDRVQEERDKLGSLEAEYSQSEEILAGQEWDFLQKEVEFYQYGLDGILPGYDSDSVTDLSTVGPQAASTMPDTVIPSRIFAYQAEAVHLGKLMKKFNNMRLERDTKAPFYPMYTLDSLDSSLDPSDSPEYAIYSGLLQEIVRCETGMKQSGMDLMPYDIPADKILFPDMATPPMEHAPLPFDNNPQVLLDGTLPNSSQGLPARDRLLKWLLVYLQESALERVYFRIILDGKLEQEKISHLDTEHSEDFAARFWLLDMCGTSMLLEKDPDLKSCQSSQYPDAEAMSNDSRHVPWKQVESLPTLTPDDELLSDANPQLPNSRSLPTLNSKNGLVFQAIPAYVRPPPLLDKTPDSPLHRFMDPTDVFQSPPDFDPDYNLRDIGGWLFSNRPATKPMETGATNKTQPLRGLEEEFPTPLTVQSNETVSDQNLPDKPILSHSPGSELRLQMYGMEQPPALEFPGTGHLEAPITVRCDSHQPSVNEESHTRKGTSSTDTEIALETKKNTYDQETNPGIGPDTVGFADVIHSKAQYNCCPTSSQTFPPRKRLEIIMCPPIGRPEAKEYLSRSVDHTQPLAPPTSPSLQSVGRTIELQRRPRTRSVSDTSVHLNRLELGSSHAQLQVPAPHRRSSSAYAVPTCGVL